MWNVFIYWYRFYRILEQQIWHDIPPLCIMTVYITVSSKYPYWQKFEFQHFQGFPRTGKDLSSSGPVLTSATFSLTSPGPVLTSPGESWRYADKDWNTEKSKTDSGPIRAEYVLYLVEKMVIGCSKKVFSVCYLTKIVKNNSLSSNNHKTTSKILVFKVLAGQLRNSRHWQGYQRASA